MIRIPNTLISPDLNFRWFCEFIVDNSPKFQTASAVAKVGAFLNVDLNTPGVREVPAEGLKLIREALLSEDPPFALPELSLNSEGGTPQKITPRVYSTYINALLLDAEPEPEADKVEPPVEVSPAVPEEAKA